MGAKHQKKKINLPKSYTNIERVAIAEEILTFIRKRTSRKGLDKNNKPFEPARNDKGNKYQGYSDSYKNSLDFKNAGKKNKINMKLSGDMLAEMDILRQSKGSVTIGFENGTEANAKADGNIRGTYGKSKPVAPSRDFLGIHSKDLKKILAEFPLPRKNQTKAKTEEKREKREERTTKSLALAKLQGDLRPDIVQDAVDEVFNGS